MAEPFDRVAPTSSTPALESDWREFAPGYLADGVLVHYFRTLLGRRADQLQVFADSTGRHVKVRAGTVTILGTYAKVETEQLLPLAANALGITRRDLIVARLNLSTDVVELDAVTGSDGTGPSPTISASIIEVPLAVVDVANGAVTIAAGAVTDRREWSVTKNGQGGLLAPRATATATQLAISTVTDITGMAVTVTIPPMRNLRIVGLIHVESVANDVLAELSIREGSTVLDYRHHKCDTGGWRIALTIESFAVTNVTSLPVTRTFKLSLAKSAGAGTSLNTDHTKPSSLAVLDAGPVWA